jgi:hypothetical protein
LRKRSLRSCHRTRYGSWGRPTCEHCGDSYAQEARKVGLEQLGVAGTNEEVKPSVGEGVSRGRRLVCTWLDPLQGRAGEIGSEQQSEALTFPTKSCVRVSRGGFVGDPLFAVAAWMTASMSSSVGLGLGSVGTWPGGVVPPVESGDDSCWRKQCRHQRLSA